MSRTVRVTATFLVALGILVVTEFVEPSRINDPKIMFALVALEDARNSIALYRKEVGSLPASLQILMDAGYIRNFRTDPWGGDYIYRVKGNEFELYSPGLDGKDHLGEGDDVTSREKKYACEEYAINCPLSPVTIVKMGSLSVVILSLVYLFGLLLVTVFRRLWRLKNAI